jgi:hypothetical protein
VQSAAPRELSAGGHVRESAFSDVLSAFGASAQVEPSRHLRPSAAGGLCGAPGNAEGAMGAIAFLHWMQVVIRLASPALHL